MVCFNREVKFLHVDRVFSAGSVHFTANWTLSELFSYIGAFLPSAEVFSRILLARVSSLVCSVLVLSELLAVKR